MTSMKTLERKHFINFDEPVFPNTKKRARGSRGSGIQKAKREALKEYNKKYDIQFTDTVLAVKLYIG